MRPSPELTPLELFVQVYNGARAFSRFLGIGMRIDNKVRARAVFRQGLDFDVALAVFGNELVFFTPIESAHRASRDANWLTARSDFRRAHVALVHQARFFNERRDAIWACRDARFATNARLLVNLDNTRFLVFGNCARRTIPQAGRSIAMVARHRNLITKHSIRDVASRFVFLPCATLVLKHTTVQIIHAKLIGLLAGNLAGFATRAFGRIEIERILNRFCHDNRPFLFFLDTDRHHDRAFLIGNELDIARVFLNLHNCARPRLGCLARGLRRLQNIRVAA